MFERYTEKTRRTIFFARYESSHLALRKLNLSICCWEFSVRTRPSPVAFLARPVRGRAFGSKLKSTRLLERRSRLPLTSR